MSTARKRTKAEAERVRQINLLATVLSLGIATGISCYCAIHHRAAKLSVLPPATAPRTGQTSC